MQDLENDGSNRRADNARPVNGWQDASLIVANIGLTNILS